MSATLFAIALNPFFSFVAERLKDTQLISGCADNIATVISSLSSLLHVCEGFQILRDFVNLALSAGKTCCTPLRMLFCQPLETFIDGIRARGAIVLVVWVIS